MELFEGKFEFVDSYGVDDYLSALGVGHVLRKVLRAAKPFMEITRIHEPGTWNIKLSSIMFVHEVEYRPDEGVQDETLDGRPCHTTLTVQKHGVVLHQIPEEGPHVKVILTKHAGDSQFITVSHNAEGKHICSFEFKRVPTQNHLSI